jgi:hypothetical protein
VSPEISRVQNYTVAYYSISIWQSAAISGRIPLLPLNPHSHSRSHYSIITTPLLSIVISLLHDSRDQQVLHPWVQEQGNARILLIIIIITITITIPIIISLLILITL